MADAKINVSVTPERLARRMEETLPTRDNALDMDQLERAHALKVAREVLETKGAKPVGMLGGTPPSTPPALADLLTAARYIVTGQVQGAYSTEPIAEAGGGPIFGGQTFTTTYASPFPDYDDPDRTEDLTGEALGDLDAADDDD